MINSTTNGALTDEMLARFEADFRSRPENQVMVNAVTRTSVQEVALNRSVINSLSMIFSNEVDYVGPITDQMRAGTCWLFAELNWLKWFAARKMNVEKFEFSENYVIYWNKLERSNLFLEKIIALRDQSWEERNLYHLLDNPAPDGGEWHLMADIIDKYGLIPKSAMPDTFNREKSGLLNQMLNYQLRTGAAQIWELHRAGKSEEALRAKKHEILKVIHRIVTIMLGEPPKKIDFGYRDKDKKYHQDLGLTPQDFYAKYVSLDPKDIYCLLSCPTPETPYNLTYTSEFFANTIGGRAMHMLNVPNEELKRLALEVLLKEEPCLFSSDVVQHSHSKEGILATNLYDYDLVFDTPFEMDKVTRIQTLQTRLTHCMVIIGVDLVEGKPTKWKIENSWGEEAGKKGFFIMDDKWFDEHVYALIIQKKYLSDETLKLFEQPPRVLPPWHPMI